MDSLAKGLSLILSVFWKVNKYLALLPLFLVIVTAQQSQAQSSDSITSFRPTNSINVGLVGDASYISFNYEKVFYSRKDIFFTIEAGMGYNRSGDIRIPFIPYYKEALLTIPVHCTVNLGEGHHYLEAGLGAARIFGDTPYNFLIYPQLGYRYMPTKPYNPNFKIYFQIVEFMSIDLDEVYFSPVGLSIGFCF